MKTFSDSAGRVWTISLTIDSVKRVKGLIDADLLALDVGDPPLITRLGLDVGEAILAAQNAFYEELISFFRQLGRKDLATAVEAQQRMINLTVEQVRLRIEGVDIEAEVKAIIGEAFTNSPESSELTPDP
jgi:hypothetical protein